LPPLSASYSGFVNGDTSASLTTQPTLSTTATAASSVAGGPYAITASGAADSNYTISYVAGSLTVTRVGLTITANSQSKAYGAALPSLTASYSGFVNGDTSASLTTQPTLSTTATAASSVAGGPYAITASGAADSNYTISYVASSLTVTPVALKITANNQTKAYGAALPALTASYNGFVNGDTSASLTKLPTLSTTATPSSSVGSYPITASGAVDPNYTISYVVGALAVTPVGLPSITITAPASGTFTVGQVATIQWTASNVDPGSTISLAYGTLSSSGANLLTTINWITINGIVAANGSGSYSWNTTGVAPGTYVVCGYLLDHGSSYFSLLSTKFTIAPPR
jgi:uncharacterized protein YjhX (UPF0386 family)